MVIKIAARKSASDYLEECRSLCEKTTYSVVGLAESFVGDRTRLLCSCDKHGEWNTTSIFSFKQGARCRKCGDEVRSERKRKEAEDRLRYQYEQDQKDSNLSFGSYNGLDTTVEVSCNTHGVVSTKWRLIKPHSIKCPKCRRKPTQRVPAIKPFDLYVDKIQAMLKPHETLLGVASEWQGYSRPATLKCRCDYHGEWDTLSLQQLKKTGSGCPACGIERSKAHAESSILSYEEVEKYPLADLELKGYVGEWKGTQSKLRVVCKSHGEHTRSVVSVKVNPVCLLCRKEKEDKDRHSKTMETVSLPEHQSIVWKGNADYFFKCNVCAVDSYAGLSESPGIFPTTRYAVAAGYIPCRCSKAPVLSEQERNHRASMICSSKGYTFLSLSYKGNGWSNVEYLCPLHGVQESNINAMEKGSGCPICAGHNYSEFYVNVVYDEDTPVGIKFGISVSSTRRLKNQNRKNLFLMKNSHTFKFSDPKSCRKAERDCLINLSCGIFSPRELKDGWTETTSLLNLEAVLSIATKNGGVQI